MRPVLTGKPREMRPTETGGDYWRVAVSHHSKAVSRLSYVITLLCETVVCGLSLAQVSSIIHQC